MSPETEMGYNENTSVSKVQLQHRRSKELSKQGVNEPEEEM